MRGPSEGIIPGALSRLGQDTIVDVFRRMCVSRYFDLGVIVAAQNKLVNYPVYLSVGQESIAAALSLAIPGFMIFAQHRAHCVYLSFGGNPIRLRDEILGLPSGTSGGRAGSNCIHSIDGNMQMFGHHGLIGENVPLGVGAAFGSGRPVVCFFGDGAAEEDYVFAAMGFAVTHKVPVLFVCVDNDLSILTKVCVRRSWKLPDVARSLGMFAYELTDDPWSLLALGKEASQKLPALIHAHTCRANWHVGIGVDGPPEWDRFGTVKQQMCAIGMSEKVKNIETEVRETMEAMWNPKLLQTLSGS